MPSISAKAVSISSSTDGPSFGLQVEAAHRHGERRGHGVDRPAHPLMDVDALVARGAQVLDGGAVGRDDDLAHREATLAHPHFDAAAQERADAATLVVGVHRDARAARVDVGPADEHAVVVLDDEHVAREVDLGQLPVVQDILQRVVGAPDALGIKNEDPAHVVPEEVVELIRADQRIQAVRLMRQLTGAKLVAAKRLVDGAAENLDSSP